MLIQSRFSAYLADGQTITDGRATITTKLLNPALPSQQLSTKMKIPIADTGIAPAAPEFCTVGNILTAIGNDGAGIHTRPVAFGSPSLIHQVGCHLLHQRS